MVGRLESYNITMFDDNYRPQRSWGKVMFLHMCVCDSVHRGGAIPACIAGGIPSCLAAGGSPPGGAWSQGGLLLGGSGPGGSAPVGVPGSGGCVAFCYGLLLWSSLMPSVMAFWFGGLLVWSSGGQKAITEGHDTRRHDTRRPPHQNATTPEGHHTKKPPYQKAITERDGCLVETPLGWLLLRAIRILLECILVANNFTQSWQC